MNTRFPFFLCCLLLYNTAFAKEKDSILFSIVSDGKWGYIDRNGTEVIPPVFLSAGNFSEGLAPARLNGNYGYIDASGKFAVAEQYDYANPFNDGLALVYKNGRPFFINHEGKKAFDMPYASATDFKYHCAIVTTTSERQGVINTKGALVLDTAYYCADSFRNGVIIVNRAQNEPLSNKPDYGLVDSDGHWLVKTGKYREMMYAGNGLYRVSTKDETWTGFINNEGEKIAGCSDAQHYRTGYAFSEGLFLVYNNIINVPETFAGWAEAKGKIVISNPSYTDGTDFKNNRAFAEISIKEYPGVAYLLIDKHGRRITHSTYDAVEDGFVNGYALVKKNNKWGVIDTDANYIIAPQFDQLDVRGITGNYLVSLSAQDNTSWNSPLPKYTLTTIPGNKTIVADMDYIDWDGFENGLLACVKDGVVQYVDTAGHVVWKGMAKSKALQKLNIDYRQYRSTYGLPLPAYNTSLSSIPKGKISLLIDSVSRDTFKNLYYAMRARVVNESKWDLELKVNSSYPIYVEALDTDGEWKALTGYYDNEFICGNGFTDERLPVGQNWSFILPVYEGAYKTKMRVRFGDEEPVYSREFEGSINPGQFWRQVKDFPFGISFPR